MAALTEQRTMRRTRCNVSNSPQTVLLVAAADADAAAAVQPVRLIYATLVDDGIESYLRIEALI